MSIRWSRIRIRNTAINIVACVTGRREPVHRLSGWRGRWADFQVGAGGFCGLARLRRLCHPVAAGPAHRIRLRLHPPHLVGHGQHQGAEPKSPVLLLFRIRIQLGLRARIRTGNLDPDPRKQKWPTKIFFTKLNIWRAGCCGLLLYFSLEVLHGKIYFTILIKKFNSPTEFIIFVH